MEISVWTQFKTTFLSRRFAIYCIGIMILALGITLNTKTNLGVSPVISLVLGWVFTRSLLGIGIDTVLAVIFTGRVMALVQKTTERIYRWCMGEQVGSAH